jgi:hypothetical protein
MSRDPNASVGIHFGNVAIKLERRLIVSVGLSQGLGDARVVAGVCRSHAVTHLPQKVAAALSTATASEEVVVLLVGCRSLDAVEHRHGRSLDGNDDGRIVLVRKDMPSYAIIFPPNVRRQVERWPGILPIFTRSIFLVCAGCHERKVDHRALVGDVRALDFVQAPCAVGKVVPDAIDLRSMHERQHVFRTPLPKPWDAYRRCMRVVWPNVIISRLFPDRCLSHFFWVDI